MKRIKEGNENIPAKNFDRLEIYVSWGYSDKKGKIDYGTTFAVIDSVFGRITDF